MASVAMPVVLVAGGLTFTDKWYWSHDPDWKIVIATVIAAGGIDLLARASDKAATALAVMILIGAATTKFNGHSAIDTVDSALSKGAASRQKKKEGK
jgi:hypothetical protein